MTNLRPRLPWVWTGVVLIASVVVLVSSDLNAGGFGSVEAAVSWLVLPPLFTGLGALIVTRVPGNRIALILFAVGVGILLDGVVQPFVGSAPTSPSTIDYAALFIANTTWVMIFFPLFLLLYLFPTGRFLTQQWSWAGWLAWLMAVVFFVVGVLIESWGPPNGDWTLDNPIGLIPNSLWDGIFGVIWMLGLLALSLGGFAALTVRYRRSDVLVRTQIKWVLYAAMVFALGYASALVANWFGGSFDDGWGRFVFIFSIALVPVAIAAAITRYRLFDIDRLVSRTLAYALVVATLTLAYTAVILGVGALATAISPTDTDLPIPVVATALVAIGFQPVRKRALRVADRLVFGKRRTPYEALAGIKEVDLDQLLPQIAQLACESTAARGAVVWLSTGTELEPAAMFPVGTKAPRQILLSDGQILSSPQLGEVFPLRYQQSLIGAITTVLDQAEELSASDRQLLENLASHAATTIKAMLDATPLPEGIVTFLMTDIEGSTRLWDEDPARMAVALRKHDELVQRLVREKGGVLVKWKGEGDSTFSVFTDPGEAVEAAMALQEAIRSHQWDLVRPISIRVAVHTGEAELRDRDYYGQTVNRCARIRSLVHGGQTLISGATRELIRSASLETLAFNDLGEHQLRDFKVPEHIYEVTSQTPVGPAEQQQAVETPAT